MKLFLDTANLADTETALAGGFIRGITTNPSLIARERGVDYLGHMKKIVEICNRYGGQISLSVEVFSNDPKEMVAQAKQFASELQYKNLAVKIPVSYKGQSNLGVIRELASSGIIVNCTAEFTSLQLVMAAASGAKYISLFYNRLRDTLKEEQFTAQREEYIRRGIVEPSDFDPKAVLREGVVLLKDYPHAEIIAGSIRTPVDVKQAGLAGAHIVTASLQILLEATMHFKTDESVDKFMQDLAGRDVAVPPQAGAILSPSPQIKSAVSEKPNEQKIVVLGADHNGVAQKNEIKKMLQDMGFACIDIGPHSIDTKVDYVDYANTVGKIINDGEATWGILVCGTGVGMDIVANRFPGVRAALVHSRDVAQKTREHNDSNVLCLGSWVNSPEENLEIVRTWFRSPFGEGRHVKRIEKINPHDRSKIVFTNGIFDILHKGHIDLLKFAKSLGGKLIVGINSDRATRLLKGPDRPVNREQDRKAILESLGFVDEVVIFDDTDTIGIIDQIQPNIVVKGAEWTAEEVRKRDHIPDHIEIKVFPLALNPDFCFAKYSTTSIVEKIKEQAPKPGAQ